METLASVDQQIRSAATAEQLSVLIAHSQLLQEQTLAVRVARRFRPGASPLALCLVSIVFAAQQDGTWSRLKVCAECHWALYDHTKNYSAAWCGSQCGARVRSRRYRQRRSSSA